MESANRFFFVDAHVIEPSMCDATPYDTRERPRTLPFIFSTLPVFSGGGGSSEESAQLEKFGPSSTPPPFAAISGERIRNGNPC